MHDPRFEPRALARLFPFAWFAVAPTPTRGRTIPPIQFEPTRTGPSAPPPWATRPSAPTPPSRGSTLSRFGVGVALALGWLVFVSWWGIVLYRERLASLTQAAAVVAALLVVCTVVMLVWARHNQRLAREGKRGHSSLYIPMQWERDTLGRRLDLAPSVRGAAEVRVDVRDGVKSYVVAREAAR